MNYRMLFVKLTIIDKYNKVLVTNDGYFLDSLYYPKELPLTKLAFDTWAQSYLDGDRYKEKMADFRRNRS